MGGESQTSIDGLIALMNSVVGRGKVMVTLAVASLIVIIRRSIKAVLGDFSCFKKAAMALFHRLFQKYEC